MSAATRNLTIDRGAEKRFTLLIESPTGTPVNLTGSTFKAEIREEHRKPLVASFVVTILSSNPLLGKIVVQLPSSASSLLDVARKYKWDLFWTDASSVRRRLLQGSVNVRPNISSV
jgi:hypothetical protein